MDCSTRKSSPTSGTARAPDDSRLKFTNLKFKNEKLFYDSIGRQTNKQTNTYEKENFVAELEKVEILEEVVDVKRKPGERKHEHNQREQTYPSTFVAVDQLRSADLGARLEVAAAAAAHHIGRARSNICRHGNA